MQRYLVLSFFAAAVLSGCGGSGTAPAAPGGGAQTLRSAASATNGSGSSWSAYDLNPSGNAIAPEPALVTGATVSFGFAKNVFTNLLVGKDASLTGDLTGKSLTDTLTVSGVSSGATFVTQHGGGCGNAPAVRFYFTTPGFAYDNFWWSNPVSHVLANGSATLSASLADPSMWSDYNGKNGSTVPASFLAAVAKVQSIGLSFGGDCFFENGATTTDGSGSFASVFSES